MGGRLPLWSGFRPVSKDNFTCRASVGSSAQFFLVGVVTVMRAVAQRVWQVAARRTERWVGALTNVGLGDAPSVTSLCASS